MAKLKALPSLKIISGFKGVIDFYIHHQSSDPESRGTGTPCARQWPRSPGHRRAPDVEAQWEVFSDAAALWSQLSPEIQLAYKTMSSATSMTGRDLFTRSYISGIFGYPH